MFSWFRNTSQGSWAAQAMACMVYADSVAHPAELEKARELLATNPVFEKLGADKATRVFDDAIAALEVGKRPVLDAFESLVGRLSERIKKQQERDFALAAVLALAFGDGAMSEAERAMALRFQETLHADIPIPPAGTPTSFRAMSLELIPAHLEARAAAEADSPAEEAGAVVASLTRLGG